MTELEIAQRFGRCLDADDFGAVAELLASDCGYDTGKQTLSGRDQIVAMYEENMREGRAKLDELVWGESRVEVRGERCFDVVFTDSLKHRGLSHTYRCVQRLRFGDDGWIVSIEHVELAGEREGLLAFYEKVGLG